MSWYWSAARRTSSAFEPPVRAPSRSAPGLRERAAVGAAGEPTGVHQDRALAALRELIRKLHGHAAPERLANDSRPLVPEGVHQVAQRVGMGAERVLATGFVRLAPPEQIGDPEPLGQRRHDALVLRVYEATRAFPREESFGLVTQLRRAAASVAANLVEGAGRLNRAEYRQFAGIARGSAAEVSYHLLLARDLGYMARDNSDKLREDYSRVGQMLTRLAQALR